MIIVSLSLCYVLINDYHLYMLGFYPEDLKHFGTFFSLIIFSQYNDTNLFTYLTVAIF